MSAQPPLDDYHLVNLSHPFFLSKELFIRVRIPDWNSDTDFQMSWNAIDTEMVKMHVLWKFTADPNYVLQFRAKCDINAQLPEHLNINTWRFM